MVCKTAKTDDKMDYQTSFQIVIFSDNHFVDNYHIHVSNNSFELGKDFQILSGRWTGRNRKILCNFQHDSGCVNG